MTDKDVRPIDGKVNGLECDFNDPSRIERLHYPGYKRMPNTFECWLPVRNIGGYYERDLTDISIDINAGVTGVNIENFGSQKEGELKIKFSDPVQCAVITEGEGNKLLKCPYK